MKDACADQLRLALTGPCGAGKSSLAEALASLDVAVIRELPGAELGGVATYAELDMYWIQHAFIASRIAQATKTGCDPPIVVFDRYFDEDVEVFLPLHQQLGGLTKRQVEELAGVAFEAKALLGSPSATVIVTADENCLRTRIGHSSRPRWLYDSLDTQLKLYARYLQQISGLVLEVDTTAMPAGSLQKIAKFIASSARTAVEGHSLLTNMSPKITWTWRDG